MSNGKQNDGFKQDNEGLLYASRAILVLFLALFAGITLVVLWHFGNHVLRADLDTIAPLNCSQAPIDGNTSTSQATGASGQQAISENAKPEHKKSTEQSTGSGKDKVNQPSPDAVVAMQTKPTDGKSGASEQEGVQRRATHCEARVWAYSIQMIGGIATLLVSIWALMAIGRMNTSRDE